MRAAGTGLFPPKAPSGRLEERNTVAGGRGNPSPDRTPRFCLLRYAAVIFPLPPGTLAQDTLGCMWKAGAQSTVKGNATSHSWVCSFPLNKSAAHVCFLAREYVPPSLSCSPAGHCEQQQSDSKPSTHPGSGVNKHTNPRAPIPS